MVRKWFTGALVAFLLGSMFVGAPAAHADSAGEISLGCEQTWHQMFFTGYYHTVNGTQYGVYQTQATNVAGSWSNCEDIQVQPNVAAGYFMTSAYARTHMCASGGGCWYNAWRWCGGGCVTATDMANGTLYSVHVAFLSVGTDYMKLID